MPGAKLADLNSVLSCVLCGGYLVNATTIVECLHSFCRACIVRYLATSKLCPICDVPVHKTRTFNYIRPDKTLQDLVYKVVPGLYQREMKKRREFYGQHPDADPDSQSPEDRGFQDDKDRVIFSPDDHISLSLEYSTGKPTEEAADEKDDTHKKSDEEVQRRFLNCPAALTISHLQKFIRMKYSLSFTYKIDILYMNDVLYEGYSLMDIAYIYSWKREGPLRLFFRISMLPPKRPLEKAPDPPSEHLVISEEKSPSDSEKEPERCEQTDEARPAPEQTHQPLEKTEVEITEEPPSAPLQDTEPAVDSAKTGQDTVQAKDGISTPATEQTLAKQQNPSSPEKADNVEPKVIEISTDMAESAPECSATVPKGETVPSRSPKIVAPVQSTPPQNEPQVAEPPAEAQLPPLAVPSPPPLPRITISTLDRNSNKIIIQTKDASATIVKVTSPVNDQGERLSQSKKSRRKEHKESSKKKSPEKVEKHSGSSSDIDGTEAPPSKRCRPESERQEVDSRRGFDMVGSQRPQTKPCSPQAPHPPNTPKDHTTSPPKNNLVSRPPPAHPQTPKTPPSVQLSSVTVTRAEEDSRPLDLSVAHRSTIVGPPKKVELAPPFPRPRGRPPLPLPAVSQPLPKQPSTYKVVPPTLTPIFHKSPPAATSSHHHHHHHRNSKHLFKGANLTCINPDPNAFHPRIVIKNVPARGPLNNFRRV